MRRMPARFRQSLLCERVKSDRRFHHKFFCLSPRGRARARRPAHEGSCFAHNGCKASPSSCASRDPATELLNVYMQFSVARFESARSAWQCKALRVDGDDGAAFDAGRFRATVPSASCKVKGFEPALLERVFVASIFAVAERRCCAMDTPKFAGPARAPARAVRSSPCRRCKIVALGPTVSGGL